jgi:uncharacterized membrane protein YecN with MAPEG domain
VVISAYTVAALILLLSILSLRVILMRRSGRGPSVGLGEDETFIRAVRAQSNLAEYAPVFLIALFLAELQGGSPQFLAGVAIVFFISRVLHAVGFGYVGKRPWRVMGTAGTLTSLIFVGGYLFVLF